jgi:single-strand DNA-binding protein
VRNLNRVVLTGGLTRDPELRQTPGGTSVATVRLGFTTLRKVGGAWQERSNYVDIEVWGAQAESVSGHLSKGRQIAVDGRLEWREFLTRDGERRQTHTVVADAVEFLADGRRTNPGVTAEVGASVQEAGTPLQQEDGIPF